MNWRKLIAIAALMVSNSFALAAGTTSGQVGTITIVAGAGGAPGDLDFRVFLVGNPIVCGSNYFAYINTSDVNYATIVANVLSARALGASVGFSWTVGPTGYCEITSIQW